LACYFATFSTAMKLAKNFAFLKPILKKGKKSNYDGRQRINCSSKITCQSNWQAASQRAKAKSRYFLSRVEAAVEVDM
jgi:hypothetical protein